jgi:hypothetical protein
LLVLLAILDFDVWIISLLTDLLLDLDGFESFFLFALVWPHLSLLELTCWALNAMD